MKRQESVVEEVTRKMKDMAQQPPVERQEIAFILGQILGLLNTLPTPQSKLDALSDSISRFTLKGVKKEE